jgi:hypothetical protein
MAGNHGDQLLVAVVQVVERAAVSRIDLIQRAAEPFAPSQHTNPHGAALQRRLGALVLPEGSNRFGVARADIEHTAPTTADRPLTTSHKRILQRDTHPPRCPTDAGVPSGAGEALARRSDSRWPTHDWSGVRGHRSSMSGKAAALDPPGGAARSHVTPAAIPSAWRAPACSVRASRARLWWGRGGSVRLATRWRLPSVSPGNRSCGEGGAHWGRCVVRNRWRRASSLCPRRGSNHPASALTSHSSRPIQTAEIASAPSPCIRSNTPRCA